MSYSLSINTEEVIKMNVVSSLYHYSCLRFLPDELDE